MSETPAFVPVGRIVGSHGLKGQVKVELLTDFPERMAKGARLRLKDDWVTVEAFQWHKERPLLKLSGIRDINAAQALQWEYLLAVDARPELEEDEFLTADLVGLAVQTVEKVALGTVDKVLSLPAQDVLVVGEIMIPVVKEFVKDVDLEKGVISVALIPGMLPDEE